MRVKEATEREFHIRLRNRVYDKHEESGSEAHDKSTDSSFASSGEENFLSYEEENSPPYEEDSKKNSLCTLTFFLTILALLIVMYFGFIYLKGETSEKGELNKKVNKKAKFQDELQDISKNFPNQNGKLWDSFNSGITTIQPSVFLLLHSGDNLASKCLVQKVANSAVKFLSNVSTEPIFIHGEEMKQNTEFLNDYGLFLKSYQADLETRNVMVIFNLQEIPPVIAQAFHSLCDTDNPLVKEAAYVFTLQVSGEYKHKPRTVAETALKSLWSNSLDIDVMDPLIIRIANIVLFVEPESDGVCS